MRRSRPPVAIAALVVGFVTAASVAGCGHATSDQLDARMNELREEMRQADERNGQQIDELDGRVGSLEDRGASLERELQRLADEFDTAMERLESAIRFAGPVHLGFDEAEVRGGDTAFLDRFASVIEEYYPDAVVTGEGFTDPAGSEAYNRRLGQRRADAVRQHLVDSGNLDPERVRAVS